LTQGGGYWVGKGGKGEGTCWRGAFQSTW